MSIKSSAKIKGTIANIETGESRSFQFNPTSYSYSQGATFNEVSSPTSPYPIFIYGAGNSNTIPISISMYDPEATGLIEPYVKFLESFLPQRDTSAFIESNPKPKELLFSYGNFVIKAIMSNLNVVYNHISEGAIPKQVDIDMEFIEIGRPTIDPGKYRPKKIKVKNPLWGEVPFDRYDASTHPYLVVDVGVHCEYMAHIENQGWDSLYSKDGVSSGTTGQGLRLEAVKVKITKPDTINLRVKYQSHIQNLGWDTICNEDEICGTVGEATRLEAMKFWLEGSDAVNYDIFYKFHVENLGWMGWAKNGSPAGSAGFSLRAEAIQIMIMPKK